MHIIPYMQLLTNSTISEDDKQCFVEINVPIVQQQFGSCDCGLFAIVFMLHLAMGDDPQHILFHIFTLAYVQLGGP